MIGLVDPATLPKMVDKKKEDGEQIRIDLAEIIGLPDFDVSLIYLRTSETGG